MTPHKQKFLHNPPHTYGDCHRAALASLLDLPLEDVPHFMDGLGPDDGAVLCKRENEFLDNIGLDHIVFPCTGDLKDVLKACGAWNGNRLFILGGESVSGCGHSVVASPSGIVHDPHPRDVGIVGPMKDGYYWITYIVGKLSR